MNYNFDTRVRPWWSISVADLGDAIGRAVSRILVLRDLWYDRRRQRRQLGMLDDRLLRDIGLDRATAWEEASKLFWRI